MTAVTIVQPRNIFSYSESNAVGDHSQLMRKLLDGVKYHYFPPATRIALETTYEELFRTFAECGVRDWDGYGAEPLSVEALDRAIRFLVLLPSTIPPPAVSPEPDGSIGFEWYVGKNWLFSLDISADDTVTYAGMFGEGVKAHGTEKLGDGIPEEILRNIRRLTATAKAA